MDHLATIENTSSSVDPVVACLEEIYSFICVSRISLSRELEPLYRKLVRVLDEIAAIDNAPSISTTDILVEDVRLDRPEGRRAVLDPSETSYASDRKASFDDPERQKQRRLGGFENADYLSEAAKVRTRDIATYQTEYSKVVRKIFTAVQNEMELRYKQKPSPVISKGGDDNTSIRAILPYPESVDKSDENVHFANITVSYWESGESDVSVKTHPVPDEFHDEKDPSLSGTIESLTKSSIRVLLGKTDETIARLVQ